VTETDYRKLCAACDEILFRSDLPEACRSISYLHIIREHPLFLGRYETLFSSGDKSEPASARIRSFLGVLKFLLRVSAMPRPPETGDRLDVLFVSHLLNPSQVDASEDFYFHDLPEVVQREGFSTEVLLINQTKAMTPERCPFLRGGVRTRILAPHRSFTDAWRDVRSLARTRSALRRAAKHEFRPLQRRILDAAADTCLSGGTLADLGIAAQVGGIVGTRRPKMLVTTSEGHAWERQAYRSATRAHQGTVCAGYQHAAVFRLQHALRRPLGDGWDPQILFASGENAKQLIQSSPELRQLPIKVLGSRRGRPSISRSTFRTSHRPTCLVIPEGTLEECQILFDFSKRWALQDPALQFVWRLHPVLAEASVFQADSVPPPNVRISRSSLDEDISESHAVLYRGSTAVIRAATEGLLPIYVSQPDELSIDLLFDLGDERLDVSSVDEAQGLVDVNALPSIKHLRSENRALQQRLDGFFSPFQHKVFCDALREIPGGA